MTYSYYRGRVYTNKEIKGPYVAAKDDFTEAYDQLQRNVGRGAANSLHTINLGDSLLITVNGFWLSISRDGMIEIGEGEV